MEIKIKYLREGVTKLVRVEGKSDWFDLAAATNVFLTAGQFARIPLGIAMELPEGYEAWIVPRSSTFKNWGIIQTNSIGIVDNSYCGDHDEWMMPVYATRDIAIESGSRVCQFRIVKNQPEFDFVEVDSLDNPDRGGFGSTGTGAVQ